MRFDKKKSKESFENLKLWYFFIKCFLKRYTIWALSHYVYDYKPIDRSQVPDNQEAKLIQENHNLNKTSQYSIVPMIY